MSIYVCFHLFLSVFMSFCLLLFPSIWLSVSLCPSPFTENHLGMRGHVDPKNVSPENIPLHCIFCPDVREFLTETSLQRYLCKSVPFCLSVYFSIHIFLCFYVFLSLCLSALLSFSLTVLLSFCLTVNLFYVSLCPSLFTENHLGMRGHVNLKNVSPENIPLHCIFCLDANEFLSETVD